MLDGNPATTNTHHRFSLAALKTERKRRREEACNYPGGGSAIALLKV
jgi:hypothetical protein